ncbi:hypothetical protein L798_03504 [Zootermopsis nevadensis]|uniref:Uncharacterized protein n=1 Tax=Zootermopsis nevadensis TaxID=136037 RepID=A0A067QG02_ZOONE|nr:hypothetical protein L798_03504 [Zootermopsis nevadensis]
MVISVYSFMKKEADSGNVINVNQIQNRVSEATGVSISTLKRILKEYEHNKRVGKEFSTPHKKRPRRKIKTDVDDFDKCVIRRTINEFHTTQGERPTLKSEQITVNLQDGSDTNSCSSSEENEREEEDAEEDDGELSGIEAL